MMDKRILWVLIIILAGGLFLRAYNLGGEDIWLDEGYAVRDSQQATFEGVITSLKEANGTPPAHFVFMHYWSIFFGTSEVALRAPSVIFGTLAILMVFFLGREIFDVRTGLISSGIMALSLTHILYSQEMRAYALFSFLTLFSALYFVRFLKRQRRFDAVFFVVSSALVITTHYLGFIVLFLYNLFYFISRYLAPGIRSDNGTRVSLRKWIVTQFGVVLLYIPIMSVALAQLQNLQRVLPVHLAGLGVPQFIANLGGFVFMLPVILAFVLIWIFFVFAASDNMWNRRIRRGWLTFIRFFKDEKVVAISLFMLLGGFFFALIFIDRLTGSFFITRYTHFLYPMGYILAAKGFLMLRNKRIILLIAALFLVISSFAIYSYHSESPRKEEWSYAAQYVREGIVDGELIVAVNRDTLLPFGYYYAGEDPTLGFKTHQDSSDNQIELFNAVDYINTLDGYWIIISHAKREQGVYSGYFSDNFVEVDRQAFFGVEVVHYRIK
jgi:mannosyltransferase